MTDEQVIEVWEAAKKNVSVFCDENHVHSARRGCLMPKKMTGDSVTDGRDVAICVLAETLLGERKLMRDVAAKLGSVFTKIGNT